MSKKRTARRRSPSKVNGIKRLEKDVNGVIRAFTKPVRKLLR